MRGAHSLCPEIPITVLLTATINPRDCSFVKRSDPAVRLLDYLDSLKKWIADPDFDDIIFCENSGHSLEEVRDGVDSVNKFGKHSASLA
jgi:hypothetical protein